MDCLADIKEWMAQNYLQVNESKGEIILFGSPSTVDKISTDLGSLAPLVKPQVRNLGVIFDSELKFNKQINSVVKSCFFQLRMISKLKPLLSSSDHNRVIQVIFSRLDYCNSYMSEL